MKFRLRGARLKQIKILPLSGKSLDMRAGHPVPWNAEAF
jgi:hypothetical protein